MVITDIPLDVLINVCEFLNPLDILSLGECNKQLYVFTKTRSLWISLIQQMIQFNTLYAPSFPIPKLTIRQLQQIASSPSRMIERFRNLAFGGYGNSKTEPGLGSGSESGARRYRINKQLTNPIGANDLSPILFPPVTKGIDTPMRVIYLPNLLSPSAFKFHDRETEFEKVCIVPGGRFLAAVFGEEAALFDLGAAGYTIGNEKNGDMDEGSAEARSHIPVYARWKHNSDDFFMPGPSCDGQEVRIAMGGSSNDDDDDDEFDMPMLSIVRIWDEESDHSDAPVRSQDVNRNENTSPVSSVRVVQHYTPLPPNHAECLSFFTLVGDLFVYAYASKINHHNHDVKTNRIHVWNFIKNECVEWEIDEGQYKELFMDGDCVVMISYPDVVGWKIPPLKPMDRRVSSRATSTSSSPYPFIYTSPQTNTLPLYPPTFRIPLIAHTNFHLTDPQPSGALNSTTTSAVSAEGEYDGYNPLEDIDSMLIGRMLDWYNVHVKVRKFDAAFARGMHYGFLSYGVEGWPVGDGAGAKGSTSAHTDSNSGETLNSPPSDPTWSMTGTPMASKPTKRDPCVILENAMYFKGDKVSRVGLVMDPFRACEGYTIKNVVASDGRGYVMVHDQGGEFEEGEEETEIQIDEQGEQIMVDGFKGKEGAEGRERQPRSLAAGMSMWMPEKVVTIELGIPGDHKRVERKGIMDEEDANGEEDEEEEEGNDVGEGEQAQSALGIVIGASDTQHHDDIAGPGVSLGGDGCSHMAGHGGTSRGSDMSFGGEPSGSVGQRGGLHAAEDNGTPLLACGDAGGTGYITMPSKDEISGAGEPESTINRYDNPITKDIDDWQGTRTDDAEKDAQCEVLPSLPDDGSLRGRSDVSFDPCSGRFCFIDKGRKMVGVVDYLRWG